MDDGGNHMNFARPQGGLIQRQTGFIVSFLLRLQLAERLSLKSRNMVSVFARLRKLTLPPI
jgi:hypothetical protein